jgi:hypothetical protein
VLLLADILCLGFVLHIGGRRCREAERRMRSSTGCLCIAALCSESIARHHTAIPRRNGGCNKSKGHGKLARQNGAVGQLFSFSWRLAVVILATHVVDFLEPTGPKIEASFGLQY